MKVTEGTRWQLVQRGKNGVWGNQRHGKLCYKTGEKGTLARFISQK